MNSRTAQNRIAIEMLTPMVSPTDSIAPKNTPKNSSGAIAHYLEHISQQLRTSEKVTRHSVLKSVKWTKSCYDLLSKIIAQDLNSRLSPKIRMQMGVSLSAKTLQKIVTGTYNVTYPIDPRTLNTLNKIVCFLGYYNWNNFVDFFEDKLKRESSEEDMETNIKRVVEEAIRCEHYAYCQLPKIEEAHVAKAYIKNSPSYNLIMGVLLDKSKKRHVISNNYNPSSFEILDMEVKKVEDRYAQVYTKVYWLLCWWDTSEGRYVKRYKDISDHFYILNRDSQGKWMIKTNASMSDLLEIV